MQMRRAERFYIPGFSVMKPADARRLRMWLEDASVPREKREAYLALMEEAVAELVEQFKNRRRGRRPERRPPLGALPVPDDTPWAARPSVKRRH